jgi:hypothetical protein
MKYSLIILSSHSILLLASVNNLVEISAALPGIDGSWNFLRFLMG